MPAALKYDFTSREFQENPLDTYELLWKQGDLAYCRIPLIGKMWFVTRFDAAREMLRDSHRFTRQADRAGLKRSSNFPWWMPGIFRDISYNMLMVDDPEHRRLRTIVDSAFARRNVEALRDQVTATAEQLLDKMDENRPVDIIDEYSRALPIRVICQLLGIPTEEQAQVMKNATGVTSSTSILAFLFGTPGLHRLRKYLWAKFEKVRKKPEPGLISYLTEVAESGDRLSREELTSTVFMLFFAGHETTTHLIAGAIPALLDHPEQKEMLQNDWRLLPGAVEEFLRFVSPVQMTKPRFVTSDMKFRGTELRRGQKVAAHIGAANWDPRAHEHPSQMNILRKPNFHLSFSAGIHSCVGMQLARLEAQVALQSLFSRYPGAKLAVDRQNIEWRNRIGMRSYKRLPLLLSP